MCKESVIFSHSTWKLMKEFQGHLGTTRQNITFQYSTRIQTYDVDFEISADKIL